MQKPASLSFAVSLSALSCHTNGLSGIALIRASDQRRSFRARYPADTRQSYGWTSRVKNFGQALEILEKQAMRCGHPLPKAEDIHDPGRVQKTSVRKLQAGFCCLTHFSKEHIHHRGTPPLSVCHPTLRSQSKTAMVYTIFLGKQGKRVYTPLVRKERRPS